MTVTVRAIEDDEVDAFLATFTLTFGVDIHGEDRRRVLAILERARSLAAFADSELIGTCSAFSLQLVLPGGASAPMAGTTLVAVKPTHRRRGAFRAMLQRHLSDAREGGDVFAGLWASESSIYGRFGYGNAVVAHSMTLATERVRFLGAPPAGSISLLPPAAAAAALPPVYDQVRSVRPGMLGRSERWWLEKTIGDSSWARKSATSKRFAMYCADGQHEGYAIYRQQERWTEFPDGEVQVLELIAATPRAHNALWRYLCAQDLFPTVRYSNLPEDDELPLLVDDGRRVQRRLHDTLWLRPLDVCAALGARRYAVDAELVLAIDDPQFSDNCGHFRLTHHAGGSEVIRTLAAADVTLDVGTLGAILLGGQPIQTFARAGRIRGAAPALETLAALLRTERAPWSAEMF